MSDAIAGATVRYQSMADGTLRLILDIEPRDAVRAVTLFGSPGTAVALAALKPARQQAQQPERAKGGVWSQWVAMRCDEPDFQRWLDVDDGSAAAAKVRMLCQVASRADIDNDPDAQARFQARIRDPWMKHYQGLAA